MVVAMIPQDGDHYAHPLDHEIAEDGDYLRSLGARQRLMLGEATFATPTERHLGLPSRDRDIEDRAIHARLIARRIRELAYDRYSMQAVDHINGPAFDFLNDLRAFVPGDNWRQARARLSDIRVR